MKKMFAWLLVLLAATAALAGCAEEEAQQDVGEGVDEPEEDAGPVEEEAQPAEEDEIGGEEETGIGAEEEAAEV